jgi:STE24 endopeptidase
MIELNGFLFCFLLLYVGQSAFNILLEQINLAYSRLLSGKPPAGFEGFIDETKLARGVDYSQEKARVGIIEQIASDAVLLAILLSGLLPHLVGWSDKLGLSLIASGILFFFVPGLIHSLVELPFSYYYTFVVEEKFGFNRSTLKLWLIDHIKGGLISAVFFALILSFLLLFIEWSPRLWWLWGFVLLSAVQLVMALLYPVVLAPLFNKFEPVRDGELSARIKEAMEKSGIRVKKILQMDAGKRSRHTNAYFTGIGKTKQIVLFDTLIESHTPDEILAVLAHEAGHYRKKHVIKQLVVFAAFSLAGFYATWLFIRWPLLFTTFGFSRPLPYVGLFLAGILWSKAGFFLQPLYMAMSRRFEKEADMFAVHMLGSGAAMATAIKRLAADNLSNLNPHPLYVRFHYSHPPLVERIKDLAEWASR